MTPNEFSQGLRKHFKIQSNTQKYLCIASSLIFKEAKIDIIKFDDWLHEQFGEYEKKEKISMKQLIKKKFGKEAMFFIQSLI